MWCVRHEVVVITGEVNVRIDFFTLCFPSGTAQFERCWDNATTNCGGNEVTGVSTAEDCCLGDGFWFQDPNLGGCVQCIGE